MNKKKYFRNKHPRFFLLLRTLKRIVLKDDVYIEKILRFEDEADHEYIEVEHNGSVDYGKTLYIIREVSDREGFCATIRFIIGYLIFAEQHGFVPEIKLSEEFVYYDKEKSREIGNPWEYYFLKEDDHYDEAKALNVCYARFFHMMKMKEYSGLNAYVTENYYNEDFFHSSGPVIKKYLTLKPEIVNEATEFLRKAKESNGKVLGVHFRGTDYRQGYHDHPVYVSEEQTIAEIKKALNAKHFAVVFLATDDGSVYDKIKDSVEGAEVLQYPDVYRSDGDTSVAFSRSDRKYHHYLLGYEIVRDMYTLSLCDGLIAGKSSVSFLSNLYKHSRNDEYEYFHIIDNGNHTNDKVFVNPSGENGDDV